MAHSDFDTPQVTVLPQTNYLLSLMTILRSSDTDSLPFVDAFDKVCGQLVPAALNLLPFESLKVDTPTGSSFSGSKLTEPICGVSILRAGASMETALRNASLGPISFGKILIQRNEETCLPREIYCKLPRDIEKRTVVVLEPMLATGGSAAKALDTLKSHGVREDKIIFLNLVASKKGLERVTAGYPALRIVTAAVDDNLTASNHIAPGLGDFGDRYYGTAD
ncbi:Uracil phosphoribosyltransferase [Paramyrothecium foliicola]|nr:Uracil phosphoribosyltransferase [Paramyrothecium foliicola]